MEVSATTARMSVFALMMEMPLVRTASGSCGSASFSAFCTSTAARSWSRVTSNVMVSVIDPSLEFVDV